MFISFFGPIPAFSTLFTLLFNPFVAYAAAGDECATVLTDTCELRWSFKNQAFTANCSVNGVVKHKVKADNYTNSVWCANGPDNHFIEVRFGVDTDGDVQNINCPSEPDPKCKSVCLAINKGRTTRSEDSTVAKNSENLINHHEIQIYFFGNESVSNRSLSSDSTSEDRVQRYERESTESLRRRSSYLPTDIGRKSRYHKKCGKSCRRRRIRRRRRNRKLLKEIASDFLLEFAKESEKHSNTNYPALVQLVKQHPRLNSQINKLQDYGVDNKVAGSLFPYHSNPVGYSSSPVTEDVKGKRYKRDPENSGDFQTKPVLCRAVAQHHDAVSIKDIDAIVERWTPPSLPFILRINGPYVRLNVQEVPPIDKNTLEHLVIQVRFKPYASSPLENNSVLTLYSSPTDVSEASFSVNNGANQTIQKTGSGAVIAAVISGAAGLLLISVTLYLLCRNKRKYFCPAKFKPGQCDCASAAERQKCLSGDKDVENPNLKNEHDSDRRVRLKDVPPVECNQIIMLEYKKHKRGRAQHKSHQAQSKPVPSGRGNTDVDQQTRRVSTCKHLITTRGSSLHDHCIVCRFAGKPHQPITDAQQYASEFLPSADRNNEEHGSIAGDGGVNRAKFDQVKNGGYKNSPNISHMTSSLPWTVKLPDGEERYQGRPEIRGSLLSEDKSFSVCVKAPPNRTIFSSDALPFAPFNNNTPKFKVDGYPGPPSSTAKRSSKRGCFSITPKGRHHSRTTREESTGCMCRYIMTHIDEPPPEYSDVISQDPSTNEIRHSQDCHAGILLSSSSDGSSDA